MASHTHVAVAYNVQLAVDAEHKLIVEQQVINQVIDLGLLTETGHRPGSTDRNRSTGERDSRC
jgi:hypothetical protein